LNIFFRIIGDVFSTASRKASQEVTEDVIKERFLTNEETEHKKESSPHI